jgi:hypothetical protein
MNKQFDYYSKNKIHAVEYVNNQNLSKLHERQRVNLLENHLGIPLSFFKGKNVLEFGPCSGENALLLFRQGALLHLVEPNRDMHPKIHKTFGFDSDDFPVLLSDEFVEDFPQGEETFDFVIAEGFLHALNNRLSIVKKLFELSGDFLIITYSCAYGYFFESFKRYIYKRVLVMSDKVQADFTENIETARNLFYEDFKKLNTSRTFESWVLDIIINPCQTSETLDGFDQYADLAEACGFRIFGTSPSWDMRNLNRWYKNESEKSIQDEWRDNLSFIITGSTKISLNKSDIEVCRKLTGLFLDYSSQDVAIPPAEIGILSKQFSGEFSEVTELIRIAETSNAAALIESYRSSEMCRCWGMPHHYIAFAKQNN